MKKIKIRKTYKYNTVINSIIYSITVLTLIYNIGIGYEMQRGSILFSSVLVLLLSFKNILTSNHNWYLFTIYTFIFYSNYSIIIANYIDVFEDTMYTSFSADIVSDIGLNILLLFTLSLSIFSKKGKAKTELFQNAMIPKSRGNTVIVLGISLVLILVLILAFERPEISGARGSPSPLYEYSIILFIVGYYFSGRKKHNIIILTILNILFAMQNFVYGGRVTGIQLILVWFIMNYSHKISIKRAVPYGFVGLLIMTSIGSQRANFTLSFEIIKQILQQMQERKFTMDTAYAAYYASLTFVKARTIDLLNSRLKLFFNFILSLFFGGSIVPNSNLARHTNQYQRHYGGGLLPYHLYYYLGWIGVVFSAWIVSLYQRMMVNSEKNSGLVQCIIIYVTVTVLRWYLYSPVPLLRGVMLTALTYYIVSHAEKILSRTSN